MQEMNTLGRANIRHRVILIVVCLIAIITVGAGIAYLVKNVSVTKAPLEETALFTPAEVLAEYAKPDVIKGLSSDKYSLQTTETAEANIIYRATDTHYIINAPTKNSLQFSAKDTKMSNDTSTIQEQTTAFMGGKYYKKIDNVGSASAKNPSFVTYENSRVVCQLSSAHPDGTSTLPGYHKLACMDKEAIQNEYTAVDSLLELYKKDVPSAVYSEVTRTTKTEGTKSMAILSLVYEDKTTSLLFAALDTKWAYIGNLSNTSGESNGKYTPSPQLRQAIRDPKYGDFLTKNIQ